MKLFRRAALGLAVVLAFAAAPRPAQAAGPYTILTQGTAPFTASGYAWELSRCSSLYMTSPANGVESRVVDVSGFAGRNVTISWTSATSSVAGGLYGQAKAYNSSCTPSNMTSWDYAMTKNTMTMSIPAGTKWALFSAFGSANISFTIN